MEKNRNMNRFRQKAVQIVIGVLILFSLCGYVSLHVQAEGVQQTQTAIVQGNVMIAAVDTIVREEPEENAAHVVELPAGTHLFIVGEEADGWYEIYYQGKKAYVPAKDLTASEIMDAAVLEQEMQNIKEKDTAFIESLETQRSALTRAKIWRIVIIVLIAAVFLTEIVSILKKNNKKEKQSE